MSIYGAIFLAIGFWRWRSGAPLPSGTLLYVLAMLPTLPVVGVIWAAGVYLRDEQDEFQRDIMVRALLWGTAAMLALSTFFVFLRGFGWPGRPPIAAEFITFVVVCAAMRLVYRFKSRVPEHEE